MMIRNKIIILIIIFYNFFSNNLYGNKIEILYKVENFPITNEDIAKEINYLIMLNKDLKNISEKELIQYATKSIIKEKGKRIEILKNFNLEGNEEVVENQLNILIKNLNLNKEEFSKLINQLNISKILME